MKATSWRTEESLQRKSRHCQLVEVPRVRRLQRAEWGVLRWVIASVTQVQAANEGHQLGRGGIPMQHPQRYGGLTAVTAAHMARLDQASSGIQLRKSRSGRVHQVT